jgi:hypothetical protein
MRGKDDRALRGEAEAGFSLPICADAEISDELRGGPGCLNRFSASISGASARVRLPSGVAAG